MPGIRCRSLILGKIMLLYVLLITYVFFGIVQVARNKRLRKLERLVWLIFVICMPVIGTSIYLRSTFVEHHGKW
jgi:Mn2+/Fe2+ NRAMP family transporter